jgi:molybdopterin adenylyltransferase
MMRIRTGIITASDRAASGVYADLSGPALRKAVEGYRWEVAGMIVVPDDKLRIQSAVQKHIASGCGLILCTGGTGVSPRDVTPEALREISLRELPGFGEVMRAESLKLTPHAVLSRSLAVVVGNALVLGLPGKPSAAVECLGFVESAIPHALEVIQGLPEGC